MATVYLADDLRHEREVALKVLKPELAALVGAQRFLAEIKTTANLQHPHILPLFDSGEADGFLFYVMPHVAGESLRDRLDRERQLPLDDAVRIASDVAEALDYAHRHGVIHRDVKPANVLLHDGQPLISDFGIALAMRTLGGSRLTETGLSLGTPRYMSPEQATGDQRVGPSTDTYSLGCVLYEMLVGEPPFTGSTPQAILGKIIMDEPGSVTAQRRSVPDNVAGAISKALEKVPADRFASPGEFRKALADEGFAHPRGKASPAVAEGDAALRLARRNPLILPLVGWATLATVAAAWFWLSPAEPALVHPSTQALVDLGDIRLHYVDEVVVSPDGSRFAVTGWLDNERGLFVRGAADEHFRQLVGAVNPSYPDFSPDGDWIAYQENSDNSLLSIPLHGGAPRVIVPASANLDPHTPHWGEDHTIVFGARGEGVYRVPATGGEATLIAKGGYWHPHLLPGGRGVLLTDPQSSSTHFVDLTTDSARELIRGGIDARYVNTGHILYADRSGVLWAVPFDVDQGVTTGNAVPVVDGISVSGSYARYAVSQNGTLIYGHGSSRRETLVVSVDGGETVLSAGSLGDPRWAPDGESIAYTQGTDGPVRNVYIFDNEVGPMPRQLTFGEADFSPVWSPDGDRIVFGRSRAGGVGNDLFVKAVHDDTPPQMLLSRSTQVVPSQWTDGGELLFWSGQGTTELWTMQVSDPTSASHFLGPEDGAQDIFLSPQGGFVVYTSEESGMREVYVRSYPVARQPVIVSQGEYPRWSPSGDTVYYWRGSTPGVQDSLFAASVQHDPSFVVLSTSLVLSGEYILSSGWDLHPDGDRLVVSRDAGVMGDGDGNRTEERHFVVTNWFEELRQRTEGN